MEVLLHCLKSHLGVNEMKIRLCTPIQLIKDDTPIKNTLFYRFTNKVIREDVVLYGMDL
jgi:hypothetical protein